jgi:hypothetical protein
MTPRKFDRLVQFDERSRKFPIRAVMPVKKPRGYTWSCQVKLDQGSEGACVGFAWAHELSARPLIVGQHEENARYYYREAQKVDEWEGETYEGTSVLAGAKTVQRLGYISEYRWAFGLSDLILAVGYAGPAVLGLNWYEGMFGTNSDGFIEPTGQVLGGHAIMCNGVNVKDEYFKLQNSWGGNWGIYGACKLSFEHMDRLLHEQGEACIPIGRKSAR